MMVSRITLMAPASALFLLGCQWFEASPVSPDGGSEDGEEQSDTSADELAVEEADGTDVSEGLPCQEPLTLCGGECVDLRSDPRHCGACGTSCAGGQVCSLSECVSACGEGLTNCSGACVDLSASPLHCGRCGRECPPAEGASPVCEDSICALVCMPGLWDIDGLPGCEYACVPSAPLEICDGLDNECNGTADDGFDCIYGTTVPCTTPCGTLGSGTCTDRCEAPQGAQCLPPQDVCNGQDDDCDGTCDEPAACCAGMTLECANTCGNGGMQICSGTCVPGPCCAASEVCGNGCDDDCDGVMCHEIVIYMTVDNWFETYLDGSPIGNGSDWQTCYSFSLQLLTGAHVLAFHAVDEDYFGGAIAGVYVDGALLSATGNPEWKTTYLAPSGAWTSVGYDDASWGAPVTCAASWGSCSNVVDAGGSWVWYPSGCDGAVLENWHRRAFTLP